MTGKFENNKKVQKKKKRSKFARFIRRNRKTISKVSLSIVLLLVGSCLGATAQKSWDKDNYAKVWEQAKTQLIETYEAELATQREQYELDIDALNAQLDSLRNPSQEELIAQEAKWLAKVLYGTARNHSANSQRTLCWCVISRVRSNKFPNTVEGVATQAKQWIDFDEEAPIIQSLYDIAYEELTKWHNGDEECDESFCYMLWSSREIQLKNTFETTKETRYWTYD